MTSFLLNFVSGTSQQSVPGRRSQLGSLKQILSSSPMSELLSLHIVLFLTNIWFWVFVGVFRHRLCDMEVVLNQMPSHWSLIRHRPYCYKWLVKVDTSARLICLWLSWQFSLGARPEFCLWSPSSSLPFWQCTGWSSCLRRTSLTTATMSTLTWAQTRVFRWCVQYMYDVRV